MRPQRNKQFDWSKPFKLIQSKKQFQQIQTGEDLVITIQSKQAQAQAAEYKKDNIITPRIQTLQRVTSVKPFAKITPNYIRLPQRLNLPKLVDYELTEVQNTFVKTHAQKFKFKGKIILTVEFLCKAFIELQLKAGKQMTIRRSKAWMVEYLQREYKQLHDWELFETFASLIYNFWKNRREELKFPLLRPLWRPNPDQFNHLLAFKPRQKQKRNLRKTTRISEDDILAELNDQFNLAKEITERVQIRQEMRLKYVQTQLALFHNQCKAFFGMPTFFGEVNAETRLKDKERLKASHQKLDRLKARREQPIEAEPEPIIYVPPPQQQQVYDQRLSVVNFLSTVIAQAQQFGIDFTAIYESKSQPVSVMMPTSSYQQLPPVVQQISTNEPVLNMSVKRSGDYLIRGFEGIQSQGESSSDQSIFLDQQNNKGIFPKRFFEDVFDFKKSQVCRLYFGQDDEGDFKDLRKNIAANFKKFQSQPKPNY